ncbi:MAG: hypothetical protein RRB13_08115 [bacterium]|nr:hypothetical protein [bacterium]
MDFPTAFKVTYQILSERSDLKAMTKKNHAKHLQAVDNNARLLFPLAFQGQEVIGLAVTNSHWRIQVVEPYKEFLFTAIKRTEALDLDSRVAFHEGRLEDFEESGFPAAFSTLAPNLMDAAERKAYFAGLAGKVAPGGRLTLTALFSDTEAMEAWKAEGPEVAKDVEDLLKVAQPLDRAALVAELEGLGFTQHWSWGKNRMLEVLHFKKG